MAGPGRPRKADTETVTTETSETEVQHGRGKRPRTRRERGRKARTPLGQPQLKMKAQAPDGMVPRWFNDQRNRITQALEAGYAFIGEEGQELDTDDERQGRDQAKKMLVGTHEDGSPMHAYLMAIPREWYEEDQKAKLQPVEETEQAIRRGNIRGSDKRDKGNYYVPDEGISVRED